MEWKRMRFRDQLVWVKVGDDGRMILDSEGRAEMKYRPEDERSYRPSSRNLVPAGDERHPLTPSRPRPAPAKTEPSPGDVPAATGDTIHVWTDGACTGNPGPMGIGVVVLAPGLRRELGEYLGKGTNNIAELTAIERGLELAEALAPDRGRPIKIYSDSAYAIGLLSKGWKAKANQELVARLRERTGRFSKVSFVKVAGHAGVPENERCDELARRAIEVRGSV